MNIIKKILISIFTPTAVKPTRADELIAQANLLIDESQALQTEACRCHQSGDTEGFHRNLDASKEKTDQATPLLAESRKLLYG